MAENKPAKKDAQGSTKSTTATKKSERFTDKDLTATEEARISEFVKRAVS
jgi:hypothetical protein